MMSRSTNFSQKGGMSFEKNKPLSSSFDIKSDQGIKNFYNSIDKASFGAPREIYNKVVGPSGYSF